MSGIESWLKVERVGGSSVVAPSLVIVEVGHEMALWWIQWSSLMMRLLGWKR